MQPMMVINGDPGQFPAPVGVLLARWAWRYRSELAPATASRPRLAAGWWAHARFPHWWGLVLAGSSAGRVADRDVRREAGTCLARGTRLRGHRDIRGRRLAGRGHRARPVHARRFPRSSQSAR